MSISGRQQSCQSWQSSWEVVQITWPIIPTEGISRTLFNYRLCFPDCYSINIVIAFISNNGHSLSFHSNNRHSLSCNYQSIHHSHVIIKIDKLYHSILMGSWPLTLYYQTKPSQSPYTVLCCTILYCIVLYDPVKSPTLTCEF